MKKISDVVEARIELAAGTAKCDGVRRATFVRLCERAYDNYKPAEFDDAAAQSTRAWIEGLLKSVSKGRTA
jgi:hypothetical protein